MPVIDALMIAASGFLVVFLMLVILWGIITVISKAVTSVESISEKNIPISFPEPEEEPVPAETKVQEEAKVYGGEIALYDVDEKTAACIMAIISDETKIPLNQLIFRSIRALSE